MFKLAKSLSPDTLLFLNDYGIIMDRCFTNLLNRPSEMAGLPCSNNK